jgi:hypothetical protein
MDIMNQIIAIADRVNFDRIRVSVLRAYQVLLDNPTLLNSLSYWNAHDNYMMLSQIVSNWEWLS